MFSSPVMCNENEQPEFLLIRSLRDEQFLFSEKEKAERKNLNVVEIVQINNKRNIHFCTTKSGEMSPALRIFSFPLFFFHEPKWNLFWPINGLGVMPNRAATHGGRSGNCTVPCAPQYNVSNC